LESYALIPEQTWRRTTPGNGPVPFGRNTVAEIGALTVESALLKVIFSAADTVNPTKLTPRTHITAMTIARPVRGVIVS
jgi:hypothetical protein